MRTTAQIIIAILLLMLASSSFAWDERRAREEARQTDYVIRLLKQKAQYEQLAVNRSFPRKDYSGTLQYLKRASDIAWHIRGMGYVPSAPYYCTTISTEISRRRESATHCLSSERLCKIAVTSAEHVIEQKLVILEQRRRSEASLSGTVSQCIMN